MNKRFKFCKYLGIILSFLIIISQCVPVMKIKAVNLATDSYKLSFIPSSVVQDDNDTVLFMTDYNNKRVVAYNYITKELSYVQFQLQPENITYANGEIYVSLLKGAHDSYNFGAQQGAIAVIEASTFKTTSPTVKDQFDIDLDPYGIAADNKGNIYVSGGSAQWTKLNVYSEETKQLISTADKSIYEKTKIQYDQAHNRIYYSGGRPYYVGAYYIDNGKLVDEGPYSFNNIDSNFSNLDLSPDGKYLFTAPTVILTRGTDKFDDRIPLKYLSDSQNWQLDAYAFNLGDNLIYAAHYNSLYVYDYKSFNELCSYDFNNNIDKLFYKDNNVIALTDDGSNNFYLLIIDKPILPAVPVLSGSTIEDGAMNVPVSKELQLTFNGNIHFNDNTLITLTDETNNKVAITPIIDGGKLTIKFNSGMDYHKVYKLSIDSKAIAGIDNTSLRKSLSISFSTMGSTDDGRLYQNVINNNVVIDSDKTINGDVILKGGQYLVIENSAKLTVTGNLINYGSIINYGELSVAGNFYCTDSLEIATSYNGNKAGNFINKGTVNKNFIKSYPEPYYFLTPNSDSTTDKATMDFTGLTHYGNDITINGRSIYSVGANLNFSTMSYQLKPGANDMDIVVRDYLGDKFEKHINVNSTMKPLNVVKVYPSDLTNNLLSINPDFYVHFDDEIQQGYSFNNITIAGIPVTAEIIADSAGKKNVLKLSCYANLNYTASYNLNIPQDAVKGSSSQLMSSNYSISFKTDKEFKRLAGSNRYETSVEISKEGWLSSKAVVLATGDDFPDALSAAPLARKLNAPILLTASTSLNNEVLNEIKRLSADTVYIIGGTGAVAQSTENTLVSMGITCKRLQGKDRFETSVAIAKELGSNGEVIIATGNNFPDALSIAPFAAYYQSPILLVDDSNMPSCVKSYIAENNITSSVVIGGTGIISDKLKNQLPNPTRLAGKDRYETNFEIISKIGADATYTYFATGEDFPDALAGSTMASYYFSPIILIDKGMNQDILQTWKYNKSKMKMKYILGGPGAVPEDIINQVFN